jgi:hypothetical protein
MAWASQEAPDRDWSLLLERVTAMLQEFREGDWVRHRSGPDLLRVIGTGATIAVRFPNGAMQAFEPCELEKVPNPHPVRKAQVRNHTQDVELGSAERFPSITTFGLICLIMVVLVVIATISL